MAHFHFRHGGRRGDGDLPPLPPRATTAGHSARVLSGLPGMPMDAASGTMVRQGEAPPPPKGVKTLSKRGGNTLHKTPPKVVPPQKNG